MTDHNTDWKSLSYNEANRILSDYESDYERYRDENKTQAETWWTDEKRSVQAKMSELRTQLNDNAPDAWGEMKDAFGAAMAELSDGYNRSIRALKR